jgi:hypothetical protein
MTISFRVIVEVVIERVKTEHGNSASQGVGRPNPIHSKNQEQEGTEGTEGRNLLCCLCSLLFKIAWLVSLTNHWAA